MKGITNSCVWMCLCYICNGSIRLLEYIDTEEIQRKHNSKHVNKTSLIRSSPNALRLCLLLQPFSGGLSIMFSGRVFIIVSSI